MPYLGQPQQTQPYRSENTFQGVQMDVPSDAAPNTVLVAAGNVHLLRQLGSEVVLQTEPGMEISFAIPLSHWVHGWAERAGILYLLLCELDAQGLATGGGQLGCWPSPEYAYQTIDPASELVTSGNLSPAYRPLQVYYGDHEALQPTDMRSQLFNLALDAPSELELQNSYDGTLNIIINDRGRNPALLINSGFVAEPPAEGDATDYGRYRLVLREGKAQTNRYHAGDFTSRLRLHPKGGSLAKAEVIDVLSGGQLFGGEYRYYFTYGDADGNETDIIAETLAVPVFECLTPAQAHGARDGERTTRRVQLRLSQLDPTFGFVHVRYVRRSGEPSAVAQAYELTQRLAISPDGSLEFSHSGYETESGISAAQLAATAGSLSTFTTMCQAGNRLLQASIRQEGVDDAPLLAFARGLQLSHQQVSLPGVPGVDGGSTADGSNDGVVGLYSPLNFGLFTGNAQGRTPYSDPRAMWSQGGHLNPLNATYRRGYPSGESVVFGVRFILKDYSLSDTYPLTGGDNLANTLRYDNIDNSVTPAIFEADQWSQSFDFGTYNRTGVYRFPELGAVDMQPLLPEGRNAVNILAARVRLLGGQVPDAIQQLAVGVQFMRAERRPNRLVQGYALPTMRSLVQPDNNTVFDHHSDLMRSTLEGKTGNLKVLPTLSGVLEAVDYNFGVGGSAEKKGIIPFTFNKNTSVGGQTYPLHDPRRMALYAPDALLQPATWLGRLNQQAIQVKTVATVFCKRAVRFTNFDPSLGTSWSLFKSTGHVLPGTLQQPRAGRSYWTLDKQFVVNDGRFGSAEKFLLGKAANDYKYLINMAWTPYVGLVLDTADLDESGVIGGGAAPNTGYEVFDTNETARAAQPSAYLVNLYGPGGVLPLSALRQLYPTEGLSFVPISARLGWQEWTDQLDGNGDLLLFGGDTYVHPMYRRLNRALTPGERLYDKFDDHVGQVLSLVCETGAHPAARSDEGTGSGSTSTGANESFVPRIGGAQGLFESYRGDATFMQAESARYNGGYATENAGSPALVQGTGYVADVPFRTREFQARVWASQPAIDGSFSNGFRFLPPLGFRDYERRLGPITRLLTAGDQQVLIVHQHGLEVLVINERALTAQSPAGPVYAQGLDFLPPTGRIISEILGCQHPLGVCVTPAGVYGLDATRQCAWFWAFGAKDVVRLSDGAVNNLLAAALKSYQDGTVRLGHHDVRVSYDAERGDVIFSLYRRDAQGGFSQALNLIYSEPLKVWMGEHNYYKAQALVSVPRRGTFSFPLKNESANTPGTWSFWRHRALPAAGPTAQRAGGYGYPHICFTEYVVRGAGVDTTKILDNLVLISEGRDPDQLSISTAEQPALFEQALVGAPADITRRTAQRREGHTWITVKGAAKRRGRWIRVRLSWLAASVEPNATPNQLPQDAGRLFKVTSIVRDSFT